MKNSFNKIYVGIMLAFGSIFAIVIAVLIFSYKTSINDEFDQQQLLRINNGLAHAKVFKEAVQRYYTTHQKLPRSNEEANIASHPETLDLSAIEIQSDGKILIMYQDDIRYNAELWLNPIVIDSKISWECTTRFSRPKRRIRPQYLPDFCQH